MADYDDNDGLDYGDDGARQRYGPQQLAASSFQMQLAVTLDAVCCCLQQQAAEKPG